MTDEPTWTSESPIIFRTQESATISKFAAAFVKAQTKIEGAVKDKTNPAFRSKYADLSAVMDACKAALNENGIGIIQTPAPAPDGRLGLTTRLLHESGEWMAGTGEIPIGRDGPQAYGSALTYARRYFLSAMVGVCPEDDDGNGASPPANQQPQRRQPPDELADDGKFLALLAEAFEAKEFSDQDRDAVKVKVCKIKKVSQLTQLNVQDRHAMLDTVVKGGFDNMRKQVPAGAGA